VAAVSVPSEVSNFGTAIFWLTPLQSVCV